MEAQPPGVGGALEVGRGGGPSQTACRLVPRPGGRARRKLTMLPLPPIVPPHPARGRGRAVGVGDGDPLRDQRRRRRHRPPFA